MRRNLTFVLVLLLLCATAEAQRARARRIRPNPTLSSVQTCLGTTYYVRTDGLDSHTGTANTAGGAWLTINKGLDTAVAGDCIRVQAGNYVEVASASNNGTSGNTITVIADGAVTTCGLSFTGQSYIRVVGLTFDRSLGGCASGNTINGTGTNTGLEFWNVTLQNNQNKGYAFDIGLGANRCDKCIWMGNTISMFGNPSNPTVMTISGDDMFASYNNFSTIAEIGIGPTGSRLRLLNNNFSGLIEVSGGHPDFYYIAVGSTGYSNSVIEANFGIGTASSPNNKFAHNQNDSSAAWVDDIYRFNVGTNVGSGIYSMYGTGNDITRMRWYHNTFVLNARDVTGTPSCGSGRADAGHTVTIFFTNELYHECWSSDSTTFIDGFVPAGGAGTLTVTKDYNLAFDPDGSVSFTSSWNNQAHEQSNIDPKLNNVASNDFTLQSASGARGVGGPLTTATSCSGTTLNVASNGGGFFIPDNSSNLAQYGGKLVPGDTITVNSTNYTVSSVSGDALTLTASISCSNGDAVYYGTTATIDIGAYPYKAGGYTLSATKSCAAGVCTITPNDASLVRFVVCYEAGVPYAVANASPYTCSNPRGTFEARVYPRYASQTLWATAN